MAQQGILKIHVLEGRLTRDTDTFGKMDPYCIFEMREQKFRTRVCNGAGKTPNWGGEVLTFDIKYIGDDITLKVFDEDPGSDDLVGTADIKVSSLCIGKGIDEWFKIQFKGKEAGVIHLRSVWEPRAAPLAGVPIGAPGVSVQIGGGYPQPGQPQMGGYPQPGYPQQMGGMPQQYPPQQMGGMPQQYPPQQMGGYPQQHPPGGMP
jgi:hypothetical protein